MGVSSWSVVGALALAFSGSALAAPIQVDFIGPAEGSGTAGWTHPAGTTEPDASIGSFRLEPGVYSIGWTGSSPNRRLRTPILFFELPNRPDGAVFTDATFSAVTIAPLGSSAPNPMPATDLWGLGYRSTATLAESHWFAGLPSDSWFEDFAGTADNIEDQVRIQAGFIPAFPEGLEESDLGGHTTSAAGGAALADFLNLLYDQGAQAGDFAVLRLNPDQFRDQNNSATTFRWTFDVASFELEATLVPEPGMLSFAAAAGTLALLRRRRP